MREAWNALAQQSFYDLSDQLPAPFSPPSVSEGLGQFFRLSFLNTLTLAAAFKSIEGGVPDKYHTDSGLTYFGAKDKYYFYKAADQLTTNSGLILPIAEGAIFVNINSSLSAEELPPIAFKLTRDGKIEKYYYGQLDRRFYEVSFIDSSNSSAGVRSWFVESRENNSYFNTKTLSRVAESEQ
jgi:hypothetical protein